MKTLSYLSFLFLISVLWLACSETNTKQFEPSLKLPSTPFDYVNYEGREIFNSEELSNDGATLGRVLFYDKNLSLTRNKSCSSCHNQSKAFSDVTAKSVGFKGALTNRNSLPIFNLKNSRNLFWDGRAESLEELAAMPIADHIEMGLNDDKAVVARLANETYYPALFEAAFGSKEITMERVTDALAQFVRSIVSYDSKYDESRKSDGNILSKKELDGKHFLNKSGCEGCHNILGSSSSRFANIGLDKQYEDEGLFYITNRERDKGRYKVPNLRNIALTAPYMHDGRFATLEEVLNHYSSGIIDHPNLDSRLRTGSSSGYWGGYYYGDDDEVEPNRFNFTDYEKSALIAFFNTLTDEQLISDEKYSNPFQ